MLTPSDLPIVDSAVTRIQISRNIFAVKRGSSQLTLGCCQVDPTGPDKQYSPIDRTLAPASPQLDTAGALQHAARTQLITALHRVVFEEFSKTPRRILTASVTDRKFVMSIHISTLGSPTPEYHSVPRVSGVCEHERRLLSSQVPSSLQHSHKPRRLCATVTAP